MKRSLGQLALAIIGMLCLASMSPAVAGMGGRVTSATSYADGTYAIIRPQSFNNSSVNCVLFSILATDAEATHNVQLEVGTVRCGGAALDGSCNNVRFVEAYDSQYGYACVPHGSFSINMDYSFRILRSSASSSTMGAYIPSYTLVEQQSGFYASDHTRLWAWGENNPPDPPGQNCQGWGPSSAQIKNWQRISYVSGGTINSTYLTGSTRTSTGPCWDTSSISSTGAFDVSSS